MNKKTPRFEAALFPGFTSIFGVFDNQTNRMRSKEDGPGPYRMLSEPPAIAMATNLNLEHEAAEKKRQEAEFETAAPKKARAKRTPPKAVETKPEPAPVVQEHKPRAKRTTRKAA